MELVKHLNISLIVKPLLGCCKSALTAHNNTIKGQIDTEYLQYWGPSVLVTFASPPSIFMESGADIMLRKLVLTPARTYCMFLHTIHVQNCSTECTYCK